MVRLYSSFLMRLWCLDEGQLRVRLEHIQSGEVMQMETLKEALAWVEARANAPPLEERKEVRLDVTANSTFTDPGAAYTHAAEWNWGDGSVKNQAMVTSPVSNSHAYTTPGVYTLTLSVTDDDSGVDSEMFQYIVVYDPDAGFVTGSGWIESPAGAYTADTTLSGKATFGFVSKYKKGATVLDGRTQF